jgi:hypothetical protein
MFQVLLGLLAAVVLLTPGGAYAQWANKPAAPQELEEARRYLEGEIATEAKREAMCKAYDEQIDEAKEDVLDSIDQRSDNRRNGRVARGEVRAAKRTEQTAALMHVSAKQCVADAQARGAELRAVLSDPVKMTAVALERRVVQQQIERKRAAQEKVEQERRLAAERAADEKAQAPRRAAEEQARAAKRYAEEAEAKAQRWAQAQREAEEERRRAATLAAEEAEARAQRLARAQREAAEEQGRAIRRDLGALLDRIAQTSRAVIDARETAYAALAQVEMGDNILRRLQDLALRAPQHQEPIAAIVEGVLALRAARTALEREIRLAASSAEMTERLRAMRGRLDPRGGSLMDRSNLDQLSREVDGVRAEHEKAARVLADQRGSLVRVVERATRVSASLQ